MNPFTPSFGEIPLVMAGREELIYRMTLAFDAENRSPELTSLLSGARGTGKTSLLAYIAELAEEHGWISVNVSAGDTMLAEILARSVRAAEHLISDSSKKRITGIDIAQFVGINWENEDSIQITWREQLEDVITALNKKKIGLFITVDEIVPESAELMQLASVYQHFVRERRKVGLMMAGLPFNVDVLLQGKTMSFWRRAERYTLGRIPDFEIRSALEKTVQQGGRAISAQASEYAVEKIEGFPYLLQLAGYRMWELHPSSKFIELEDAQEGCSIASSELRERVLESSYRDLSNGDIAFLEAMLEDSGDSDLKEVAVRMGKSSGYISAYRKRMLAAGIIGERRKGVVGFDLPGFKDFLKEKLEDEKP